MLDTLKAWLRQVFAPQAEPQAALVTCLSKRGVNHARWKARDRSRHRVCTALYDDLLQ